MTHLYEAIEERVSAWRDSHYACDEYQAIAKILDFALMEDGSNQFLRAAQLKALETYWYLRLKLDTPTVPQLYKTLFPKRGERRAALGVSRKVHFPNRIAILMA